MKQTYWQDNGNYQKEYEALYQLLVPEMGNCKTLEGEMLRASCRLYYDYYNNGMCNNTSGAARFLMAKLPLTDVTRVALDEIYDECNSGGYSTADLEGPLEVIANEVMAYIISKDEKYTDNTEDLFDYQEPDFVEEEDDYDDDDEELYFDQDDYVVG
jgi:hypothetical protein